MPGRLFIRKSLIFFALSLLGLLLSVGFTDFWIGSSTSHSHTAEIKQVTHHEVALVLGCSEYLRNGRLNLYFLHRVNAASELYHAGKCHYLIVSGDNNCEDYNEPEALRRALVNRGVPDSRIYSDFAGFRTLDSVVRAKEIFSQDALIVVSQQFHNERAIFIANQRGIKLVGFNAHDVTSSAGIKTAVREKLARFKTTLDLFVTNKEPKFLGTPVAIPR